MVQWTGQTRSRLSAAAAPAASATPRPRVRARKVDLARIGASSTRFRSAIGAAAADMAMKTQGAVAAMATAIVDTVEKMAMMVIADWMGVADAAAIANTIEEEGIWALAGAAVTLAAVAAVFEGIKSLIPKEKFSAPTTAVSNTPGTTSAVGGLGGSAVSSSQQMITNNVSVNLGLQALDLASVSDSQLQNLVYRLGRLLKQAAATGQFSLG